jgi:glyoxylase-like metal-dependent hydrolase (beta-lactamase superfamily II)
MKKQLLAAVGATLCCMALGAGAQQRAAAPRAAAPPQQDFSKVEIHTLKVRDNLYMLVGSGGNITVQIGDDGILLVDTQYAPLSDKILAAIRKLSDKPIHYIVDTHHHGDHTGGNSNLRLAGNTVSGGNMAGAIRDAGVGAAIIAHENVLNRLSTDKTPGALPSSGWPTSTYFGAKKELYFNNEGIEILHMPAAHTDGDSIVFFRRSDVISTGDVFVTNSYPFIDIASGGSYAGIVKALDRIEDIVIPVYGQDGGTLVIPGHGRLSNLGDVLNFREMIIVVRDRIQEMINAGMTLEQVKAAKPTFDYDPVYGATTGFITTDSFVEAAYQSLKNPPEDPQ